MGLLVTANTYYLPQNLANGKFVFCISIVKLVCVKNNQKNVIQTRMCYAIAVALNFILVASLMTWNKPGTYTFWASITTNDLQNSQCLPNLLPHPDFVIVVTRLSLDFHQTLWAWTIRANMNYSCAQEICTLELNLAGKSCNTYCTAANAKQTEHRSNGICC